MDRRNSLFPEVDAFLKSTTAFSSRPRSITAATSGRDEEAFPTLGLCENPDTIFLDFLHSFEVCGVNVLGLDCSPVVVNHAGDGDGRLPSRDSFCPHF